MVAGRTPEPRSVTVTTNASTALTGASGTFNKEDAGRPISGTGIPNGATLASVTSSTAATLSANATASGSITAALGGYRSDAYGFRGWVPESDAESKTYTVAAVGAGQTPPDRIANPITPITRRARG
jgi:hypothetical protein